MLLEQFLERFRYETDGGQGHFVLLCYAAFPAVVTPDLLYKLWMNFSSYHDETGRVQHIRRVVVSDVLLSGLLREIGPERYQLSASLRNACMWWLRNAADSAFKLATVEELGFFMLDYLDNYFVVKSPTDKALREAQEWNAWSYLQPEVAIGLMSNVLRQSSSTKVTERLRLSLVLEEIAQKVQTMDTPQHQQTAETLQQFSKGWQHYLKGQPDTALQFFRQSTTDDALTMTMPVPKQVFEQLQEEQRQRQREPQYFYLGVGIEEYADERLYALKGCRNDVRYFTNLVKKRLKNLNLPLQRRIFLSEDKREFSDAIKQELSESNIQEALELLYDFFLQTNNPLQNKTFSLIEKYFNFEQLLEKAKISSRESLEKKARISENISQLLKSLDDSTYSQYSSSIVQEESYSPDDYLNALNEELTIQGIDIVSKDELLEYHSSRFNTRGYGTDITKHIVISAWQELLSSAQPNDTLLFQFSGHGENWKQGSNENKLFFYDYNGKDGFITESEFRNLTEELAPPDVTIILILDTHAGGDGWLDVSKGKRIILSACSNYETSYENAEKERGAFTNALIEVLEETQGQVTYRQLMKQVRLRVQQGYDQTPQLVGNEAILNRLFLQKQDNPVFRLQELLQESGYYHDTISGELNDETLTALQSFDQNIDITPIQENSNPEVIQAFIPPLQRKVLVQGAEELRIAFVSSKHLNINRRYRENYSDQFINILEEQLQRLNFPHQLNFVTERQRPAQKVQSSSSIFQAQNFQLDWTAIEDAHVILFLLDTRLLQHEQYQRLVTTVSQQATVMGAQLVVVLLDTKDWPQPDLSNLHLFPSHRQPIYWANNEYQTGDKIRMALSEIEALLDELAAYLPPPIAQRIKEAYNTGELDLSNLKLKKLPPEIVELRSLYKLNLSGNELTEIPASIVQLRQLAALDLSNNQFSRFPEAITNLPMLSELNLQANTISVLPERIAALQQLESLWLGNNQLTALPKTLIALKNLKNLSLNHNQFTEFPPVLLQLYGLRRLHLNGNQIAVLPPEIGQLQELTELELRNNKLTALPIELTQLHKVYKLRLQGNPLIGISEEVLMSGVEKDIFEAILALQRSA